MTVRPTELKLDIERIGTVSAILMQPDNARACYVLAHGAGTDMRHASMDKMAVGLAERGITTLRFNFPYMENKQGRPDQLRHAGGWFERFMRTAEGIVEPSEGEDADVSRASRP